MNDKLKAKLKYYLFWFYASQCWWFIKPKNCYVIDKSKCPIWNCKYHYHDRKYDVCQKFKDP